MEVKDASCTHSSNDQVGPQVRYRRIPMTLTKWSHMITTLPISFLASPIFSCVHIPYTVYTQYFFHFVSIEPEWKKRFGTEWNQETQKHLPWPRYFAKAPGAVAVEVGPSPRKDGKNAGWNRIEQGQMFSKQSKHNGTGSHITCHKLLSQQFRSFALWTRHRHIFSINIDQYVVKIPADESETWVECLNPHESFFLIKLLPSLSSRNRTWGLNLCAFPAGCMDPGQWCLPKRLGWWSFPQSNMQSPPDAIVANSSKHIKASQIRQRNTSKPCIPDQYAHLP